MEYKIVQVEAAASFAGAIKKVEKEVNTLLNEGWDLHGDLKITCHSNSVYFVVAQALIKQKE